MHKVTLSKTLLTALSKYERFLAAIDTAIQTIAETSYQHYASTQKTIEDIIDNIDKKTTLHNLRVKTEKLLTETPHKYARVLILTYVHRLTSKKVAQIIKKNRAHRIPLFALRLAVVYRAP